MIKVILKDMIKVQISQEEMRGCFVGDGFVNIILNFSL